MSRHIGKFEDLKTVVKKSRDECVYICPYCDIVSNKGPDTRGKFYFNIKKGKGHCFRCETLIYREGIRSIESIIEELNPNYTEKESYKEQLLNISGWSTSIIENRDCLNYMINRGIQLETLHKFNVRSTNIPHLGVVFINKLIDGKYTDFYQIRNIDAWCKHATLRDLVKPCNWLDVQEKGSDVIICEGFVDGLSCYEHLDGKVFPTPLVGKSLTKMQLLQLVKHVRNNGVSTIYVCMDGGFFESTLSIARTLHKKVVRCTIKVVPMPWGKDPNEICKEDFLKCIEKSLIYSPENERYIRSIVYGNKR